MKTKDLDKKELADLKWQGPFEPIPFADKPGAEDSEKYGVFAMIEGYENEGRKILDTVGYPLTRDELSKRPKNERKQIRNIELMLIYFREVRIYISLEDAAGAALSMAYAIRCAMLARIRPFELSIEIGTKRRNKQKKTRSKRTTWKGLSQDELEKRNQKIKEHFQKSKLKPNSFAKKHSAKYKLSTRRITQIIQSQVGS